MKMIDLIYPNLINKERGLKAWFTTRNPALTVENSVIEGLNLGRNTPDRREVIESNRIYLFNQLEIDKEWTAFADQVHGNRVQIVSQGGVYPETDGLVTAVPALTLAIQVADCAAVLLGDSQNRVIGAAHAGWRGAVGGVLENTLKKMVDSGASFENIRVFISPCICTKHFEVGMEVAEQFPDRFVDYHTYEKPHVDLKAFLTWQMKDMGIQENHIEIHGGCTVSENHKYYSYRREDDKSGRMLGLVQLT